MFRLTFRRTSARAAMLGWSVVVLSACGWTQGLKPATPCIDLSAQPAATNPASGRGVIYRVGRIAGMQSAVDITADQNVCPLSANQKFRVWAKKSYSPVNLFVAALDAAIWQAIEGRDRRGYGQGWDAYGARFGASLANTESARLFQTLLFPTLLKEDPRYFRAARGTAKHRIEYAITRVLVARTDGGRHRFNFSEVLGAGAAAGLSNVYYPEAARTAGHTAGWIGLNLGTSAGWNILYEFGPDLLRKFGKSKTTD